MELPASVPRLALPMTPWLAARLALRLLRAFGSPDGKFRPSRTHLSRGTGNFLEAGKLNGTRLGIVGTLRTANGAVSDGISAAAIGSAVGCARAREFVLNLFIKQNC
jgi:hypothetical protein